MIKDEDRVLIMPICPHCGAKNEFPGKQSMKCVKCSKRFNTMRGVGLALKGID